jgi:hypothetical protein
VKRARVSIGHLWGLGLLVVTVALGTGGCLFEPRDTESPATGEQIDYLPYSSPQNVLQNAQTAFTSGDQSGYDRMIADSFQYIPDGQTTNDFPDIDWDSWGREQEVAFAGNLFNSGAEVQSIDLSEEVIRQDEPSGTTAEWEVIYSLDLLSSDGTPQKFRGHMIVRLELIVSEWYIISWEDLNGEDDPGSGESLTTMGRLRGAFASQ